MTERADGSARIGMHRAGIEDAFARRLPATLSILLEAVAVQFETTGDPRSLMLRSASSITYRGHVDAARALFDSALDATADSTPGDG